MTNDIIKRQELSMNTWEMIGKMAPIMHRSRLFGVSSEEQAIAIMAKGYELGLSMTSSFELIVVIEGKPSLIPRGALALVHASGLLEEFEVIEENDDKGNPYACTVRGKRKNGMRYALRFTMDDAKRAGLLVTANGKLSANWLHYPANMLKWRTIGYWIDVVMSDVQGGMKRADEFGATVDASGNVIDAQVIEAPALTLDTLITEYGDERVLAGCEHLFGGNPPADGVQMSALSDWLFAQIGEEEQ